MKSPIGSKKRSVLMTSGLILTAWLGFAVPAGAEQPADGGNSYTALLEFVQRVDGQPAAGARTSAALPNFIELSGTEQPQRISASVPNDDVHAAVRGSARQSGSTDDYAALRDFAKQVEGGGPAALKAIEPGSLDEVRAAVFGESAVVSDAAPVRLAQAAKKPAKAAAKPRPLEGGAASFVGAQKCMQCHSELATAFSTTLMGRIAKTQKGKLECEGCHGPGSLHVAAGGGRGVGGMNNFKPQTPEDIERNNGICLACHEKGERTLWKSSTHEQRGLACTNCHTVMRKVSPKFQLKTAYEIDTCFQCHKNKRAEIWRSSHMPVREGKMTCSNCHNPHGTFSESNLREATINDVCYKCHAEKRGPFLWEHAPVRENCVNCHDPHGSINDFLLKMPRPRVCQQCHANLTGHPGNPRNITSVLALNRGCQNCHSQHHGSNSPSGLRQHR